MQIIELLNLFKLIPKLLSPMTARCWDLSLPSPKKQGVVVRYLIALAVVAMMGSVVQAQDCGVAAVITYKAVQTTRAVTKMVPKVVYEPVTTCETVTTLVPVMECRVVTVEKVCCETKTSHLKKAQVRRAARLADRASRAACRIR